MNGMVQKDSKPLETYRAFGLDGNEVYFTDEKEAEDYQLSVFRKCRDGIQRHIDKSTAQQGFILA